MLTISDSLLLQRSLLFDDLPSAVCARISNRAATVEFKCGRHIFYHGDVAERCYFVLSGSIKAYRNTAGGEEVILDLFVPTDPIFATAAYLNSSYPASTQALEDSRLISLPAEAVRAETHHNRILVRNLLASVENYENHLLDEIEQLKICSATQRVVAFLLHLTPARHGPAIVYLPYDKHLISRYVGIQPESLSRIFGKLRQLGVSVDRNVVKIKNIASLVEFSDVDLPNKATA